MSWLLPLLLACSSPSPTPAPSPAPDAEVNAPEPAPAVKTVPFSCRLSPKLAPLEVVLSYRRPDGFEGTVASRVERDGTVRGDIPTDVEELWIAVAEHAETRTGVDRAVDGSLVCDRAIRPLPAATLTGVVKGMKGKASLTACGKVRSLPADGAFSVRIPADQPCSVTAQREVGTDVLQTAPITVQVPRGQTETITLTLP